MSKEEDFINNKTVDEAITSESITSVFNDLKNDLLTLFSTKIDEKMKLFEQNFLDLHEKLKKKR